MNAFLCFTQKFKMAGKNSRKMIFGKSRHMTLILCKYHGGKKLHHLTLHHFRHKCIFFVFYSEILDSCLIWRENEFGEKSPDDTEDALGGQNFTEITISRTVSEINAFT